MKTRTTFKFGQILLFAFGALLLSFQYSCKDDLTEMHNEAALEHSNTNAYARSFSGDSIVLKNPYSVEIMKTALEQLRAKNPKQTAGFEVRPSHLYLKFNPKNEDEVGLLKQDSTIHYFDYRLDAEYAEGFLENRAPDRDSIPVYYTAVPVGKNLPAVEHEVLSELYIPEQDPYFSDIDDIERYEVTGKLANKTDLFNNLLYLAYELTGNEEDLLTDDSTPQAKWIFGKKWYPSGRIQVKDDILDVVPVTGAQVLMRQWFTVAQGITDGNGYFSTSSVRGKAKYVIQWERYNYSVRNGSIFQAEMKGPNVKQQAWYPVIDGGEDEYHALIHQAAHDFYYGYRFGLTSPPMNNHIYNFGRQSQIKIAARKTAPWGVPSSYSHIRSELTFGLSAQIHIKAYGRLSDMVYGTTIHELSHALHSIIDRSAYNDICQDSFLSFNSAVKNRNRRLLESWPTTVETLMTLERYKRIRGYAVYRSTGSNNFQNRTISAENHYTSGGYDMIDGHNQNGMYGVGYPADRVTGYTASQLEQALKGSRNWYQWRDKIKNNYSNPTSIYLDELFANWPD
ncbi:hypothetical protein [Chryseobacterium sp.]|uniref:hypothetical protein n=1 Tax=Chryseobacterium sp. TaxID=1871047 RepID=UPI0024E21F74|nr:hypothetical protein [Chryseobacterium sp.]